MARQKRVVWTKGMFLSPQHFQAQDRYFEDLVQARFFASNFGNYGVTQLEIDLEALANGNVKLISARGFLPDGAAFDMPASDELPPLRAIGKQFTLDLETLDVFLALPDLRPNAKNVSLQRESSGPAETRYVAELSMMPDANQGFDEKPVQLGNKSFRLLFGNEFRDGFNAIRIARLARNSAGAPILHPTSVAPCLDLNSSDYLMGLIRRQVEILATKSSALAGPRRERSKGVADVSASDTASFWLLHTVNSYLPELRHIYKVRRGHPEVAYRAMLRLAGALSTFTTEGSAAELPDYDHDELGACFTALDARILELMRTVIKDNYVAIPLTLTERFTWTGTVTDSNLFQKSQFYLSVSASTLGIDEIIRRVPKFLRLATSDEIEQITRNALPGVTLRHVEVPPKEIPIRLGNQYFALNQNGDIWKSIMLSRSVAVYAPADIPDPKLELLVVLE
jgi:type VI secretion system protein ImpJ